MAELAGGVHRLGHGLAPAGAAGGEEAHGPEGAVLGVLEEAAPAGGLGAPEEELGGEEAVRVLDAAEAAAGAIEGGLEVVALEGVLGGALVEAGGAGVVEPALEVLGEHHGVALAGRLQPLAGEEVAERAVGVGEHPVGGLADQRVAEAEAGVAGGGDHLLLGEGAEPGVGPEPAEERGDALLPEGLAEDAGGAEDAALLDVERLQAGLHDGQHRLGEGRALPLGDGPDQLLEEEGVAVGPLHQAGHRLGGGGAPQRRAHQALAGAAGEAAQVDLLDAAPGPEIGEDLVYLRAAEPEHQEGPRLQVAEGGVDELDGGQVPPVEILEHQHEGATRRLGAEEVLPRAAHLVAEEDGIAARGAELHVVGEGRAQELAEECGHPRRLGRARLAQGHALAEEAPAHVDREALAEAQRPAERLPEQAERGSGAHGIAAPDPDLRRVGAPAEAAEQLGGEPRLADPRGRRDQDGVGPRLLDAAGVGVLQGGDLALAAHAGRGLAEEGAGGVDGFALAREPAPRLHDEARPEEPHAHLVHPDHPRRAGRRDRRDRRLRRRPREERHRAIDELAHQPLAGGAPLAAGGRPRRLGAARDGDHRRPRPERRDRERAAGRAGGEVGGLPVAGEDHQRRSVGEQLELPPVPLDGAVEPALQLARGALAGAGGIAGQHQGHHPPLAGADLGLARSRGGGAAGAERGDRRRHRGPVGRPRRRILGEHPGHEIVERGGHAHPEIAQARGLLDDDLEQDREIVVAHERSLAGHAAEEHAPEREHVRPRVDEGLSPRLLRRQVPHRPQHHARGGEVAAPALARAHQAEVDELDLRHPPPHEEDVARLEIAVDEPLAVHHGQRRGQAGAELDALLDAERPLGDPLPQRGPLQPLHRQPRHALVREPVGHVAHDGRVLQPEQRVHLPLEPHRPLGGVPVEELEGHPLPGRPILRPVDVAHPPRRDAALDLEAVVHHLTGVHPGPSMAEWGGGGERGSAAGGAVGGRDGRRGPFWGVAGVDLVLPRPGRGLSSAAP